jgi:N-acetylgalactosamine kinase
MTTFAAKFANKDTADEFLKVWTDAKATNAAAPSAPAPAPAPGVAAAHVDASGPVPVVDGLAAIYGEDKAGEMAGRYAALADAFRAAHGREPAVFVRAPGRVNLIGEHIDYHGYSVLPMALQTQDVVIAVALDDSGAGGVKVTNAAPGWDAGELPLDPGARVEFEAGVKWWQYVQCGYKGAFEFAASKGRPAAPKPLRLTVDGRVPPGAGVSSSSALVVASFLAVAQALGIVAATRMTKAELGEATRACELHIGTMSGGMDQAASAMGTAGAASRIDFEPLKATPVRLPAGAAFVVSNCMEPSPKAVDAEKRYNKRVTEGKLGAKLVAKGEGLPGWAAVATFRGLQEALGLSSPGGLLPAIARHLREGPYSIDDVAAAAGADVEGLFEGDGKRAGALKVVASVGKSEPAFELLKRGA